MVKLVLFLPLEVVFLVLQWLLPWYATRDRLDRIYGKRTYRVSKTPHVIKWGSFSRFMQTTPRLNFKSRFFDLETGSFNSYRLVPLASVSSFTALVTSKGLIFYLRFFLSLWVLIICTHYHHPRCGRSPSHHPSLNPITPSALDFFCFPLYPAQFSQILKPTPDFTQIPLDPQNFWYGIAVLSLPSHLHRFAGTALRNQNQMRSSMLSVRCSPSLGLALMLISYLRRMLTRFALSVFVLNCLLVFFFNNFFLCSFMLEFKWV